MSGDLNLIISDVHCRFAVVNSQIAHAEKLAGRPVDRVFVLGDLGFFQDEMHGWFRRSGNRFLRPVFCVEGNHEDHADLANLTARYADVVTYQPRGSVINMSPWRGLCLGGARYMDAGTTPRGSEITPADIKACLRHPRGSVDVLLTHDCPAHVGVPQTAGLEHYGPTGVPEMLELAEFFRPRWWFFGHHHRWFDHVVAGTRFVGLPHSWNGYVLLDAEDELRLVDHRIPLPRSSWWRRLFRFISPDQ